MPAQPSCIAMSDIIMDVPGMESMAGIAKAGAAPLRKTPSATTNAATRRPRKRPNMARTIRPGTLPIKDRLME
jgi:hypothetical protein